MCRAVEGSALFLAVKEVFAYPVDKFFANAFENTKNSVIFAEE